VITIFTTLKPCRGQFATIQKNAVMSWSLLYPSCEIIIFGDEEGTEQLTAELGLRHYHDIVCNEHGTPLVSALFMEASRLASHSILAYVNADIILMKDFIVAVEAVKDLGTFLMVGRRWDVSVTEPIDFSEARWEEELRSVVAEKGRLHSAQAIDYFVFNRQLWKDGIPPFAIGRTAWDGWLIFDACRRKVPVVDATEVVMAVHQDHEYNLSSVSCEKGEHWKGPEVRVNKRLAGRQAVNSSSSDAGLLLTREGLKPRRTSVRLRRFVVRHCPSLATAVVRSGRRVGLIKENGK